MPTKRTAKYVDAGEREQCPYCRQKFHPDILLDNAMDEFDKKREQLDSTE